MLQVVQPQEVRYTYHGCWNERVQEIVAAYVEDLGGEDAIGVAERSVLLRVAVLTYECEYMECGFSHNRKDNNALRAYAYLCGTLGRLLDLISLKPRVPKSMVPTLDEYIREAAE